MITFKKPFYNYNKITDVEHFSGKANKKVVDTLSFVPFQDRIKALLASGQVLADHRAELYDFVPHPDAISGVVNEMSNETFDATSCAKPLGDILDSELDASEACRRAIENASVMKDVEQSDKNASMALQNAINADSVANQATVLSGVAEKSASAGTATSPTSVSE